MKYLHSHLFPCTLVLSLSVIFAPLFAASVSYQEDVATNFNNPERGVRNGTETLVRIYYHLESYTGVDILPQSVFDKVAADCENYRSKGMKIIPRFIYQFGCVGIDAPLPRILLHIEQLGKVLRENSDVIALLEAGFIGAWGEWHHSGCSDKQNLDNTPSRTAILFKLLSVLPKDRMVVLRYNYIKRQIFGTDIPLGPDSAFSGSYRARTGAMNDCFRYDATDRGTYQGNSPVEWQKNYLNQDNRYVPQEGETCGSSKYSVCDSAIKDFKRMHWDDLSDGSLTSQWTSGGCLNTIRTHYGYRIVLKNATLPDSVRPGNYFNASINMINVGWGKIYNPRGCELVFKNSVTKNQYIVKLANDPRRWTMTDSTVNVQLSALLPTSMTEGAYQVFLNLPDTAQRLYGRKEYSIRLANLNLWDDVTGYNSLLHTVNISMKAPPSGSTTGNINGSYGFGTYQIKQKNGFVQLSYSDNTLLPILFEIYTLSGRKLWSRSVLPDAQGMRVANWTGPSSQVYISKLSLGGNLLGERKSAPIQSLIFKL